MIFDEIIKKYGQGREWEVKELRDFATNMNFEVTTTRMYGRVIVSGVEDSEVDRFVTEYTSYFLDHHEEERIKQEAMSSILITSGFSFEGYSIKKYSGYISGDDAIEVDREYQGFFSGRYNRAVDGLMDALVTIRRNALNELKLAAYDLGCNAVIGVDFDYLTLEPETANMAGITTYLPFVFGVTANGNAVVIEKNES